MYLRKRQAENLFAIENVDQKLLARCKQTVEEIVVGGKFYNNLILGIQYLEISTTKRKNHIEVLCCSHQM